MQLNEDLCYHMKQKSCSGFYCLGHKKNLTEKSYIQQPETKLNDGNMCSCSTVHILTIIYKCTNVLRYIYPGAESLG